MCYSSVYHFGIEWTNWPKKQSKFGEWKKIKKKYHKNKTGIRTKLQNKATAIEEKKQIHTISVLNENAVCDKFSINKHIGRICVYQKEEDTEQQREAKKKKSKRKTKRKEIKKKSGELTVKQKLPEIKWRTLKTVNEREWEFYCVRLVQMFAILKVFLWNYYLHRKKWYFSSRKTVDHEHIEWGKFQIKSFIFSSLFLSLFFFLFHFIHFLFISIDNNFVCPWWKMILLLVLFVYVSVEVYLQEKNWKHS